MIIQFHLKLDKFCCILGFWINRIFEKAKDRYSKEKVAEYYLKNKDQ